MWNIKFLERYFERKRLFFNLKLNILVLKFFLEMFDKKYTTIYNNILLID